MSEAQPPEVRRDTPLREILKTHRSSLWPAITLGATGLGATLILGRALTSARRRRYLLESGQLAELHGARTQAGGDTIYSRFSIAGGHEDRLPVVLVHGWGMSSSYFVPLAERLAADGFAVYVPDLPGHGRSDRPRQPLDAREFAQTLRAWMRTLGIDRATIVGHSMGCQVAIEAALADPERCARLVLIGLVPDPLARSTGKKFWRLALGGIYERLALIEHMVKDFSRVGRRLVPEFYSMREYPIEQQLSKLTIPVMIARGENDLLAPQRWCEEAARLSRAERLVVIPGWGHAVQFSAPDETLEAIAPFLIKRSEVALFDARSL